MTRAAVSRQQRITSNVSTLPSKRLNDPASACDRRYRYSVASADKSTLKGAGKDKLKSAYEEALDRLKFDKEVFS